MNKPVIIFDLDGTLVDTAPDLVNAANFALRDMDMHLATISIASLKPYIGLGARRMIIEGLRLSDIELPEDEIDKLLALFLAHYAEHIAAESRPYPGAVDALDRLKRSGWSLAICTNKRHALALSLLDALELTHYFAAIAGRDTFTVSKPHGDHVLGTIALAGGDPRQAILVGDSPVDVAAARAAEVPVIGVTHGYSDTPMIELNPDQTIDHFRELEPAIRRIVSSATTVRHPKAL